MNEDVLVSIITVCYNSATTIEDTIKSVISQTYKNWEHIIVDGGSKDNTITIIRKYEKEYGERLKIHQGPDKGIYDAMNKGINFAQGKIIGIINSDDWYAPDALENVVTAYLSCPGEEKVITGGLKRMRDGIALYTQMHTEINVEKLKRGMPLQHPAVFITKSIYNKIGGFDLSYPHLGDYDLIWRCYNNSNIKFIFVNSIVSFMRDGGASDCLSWKHIWSRTRERYKLRKKYIPKIEAFLSSAKFLIHEYVFQLSKKALGTNDVQKVYKLKHRGAKGFMKSIRHKTNKILKKVPFFRNSLIYLYHFLRYYCVGNMRKLKGYKFGILTHGKLITPKGRNCYFGYYDKSPYASDGKHYLFLMINGKKKPKVGEKAKICYATSNEKYDIIGDTLAWNSQQGAMLRFINDNIISWNDFDEQNKRYINVCYNIRNKSKYVLREPLYDVSDDGFHGLSIDFERLNVDAEGYGYIQLQRKNFNKDSYIKYVDLKSGNIKNIVTIEKLTMQYPVPKNIKFAYFNHLELNPLGNRFIFIFRYIVDQRRYSRLFSSNLDGQEINLLADEELVSHCTWKDNNNVTLWCRLNGKNNYYTIEDTKDAKSIVLGKNTPNEDGHPSYNADKTKIITDTYPDKAEYRHLIVYDCVNDCCKDIARLYAPILLHGPKRCDFHPRWHPNMKQVVIDSVHKGFRGLYLIDIN